MIFRPAKWSKLPLAAYLLVSASPMLIAAQAPPPPAAKAARDALLQADRSLSASAQSKGFADGVADALAGDALFLYEGAPIVAGRAKVLGLLKSQPGLSGLRVQWQPLVAIVSTDGSLGATWGVTAISSAGKPDSALRFAKYISTWRRGPGGAWQLAAHVDMGLSSEAAVLSPNLKENSTVSGNPLAGAGAPFAKADIDFAKLAAASGAPVAFGAFAAPDAATLPGSGEIIVGPPAIRARMLESPVAAATWDWRPVYSEGAASGDLGFTVGEATIKIPGPNGVTDYHSKYLTVWRRQPDGSARFVVDGGNGR
jgi:ketosteroid isomerase-like protein